MKRANPVEGYSYAMQKRIVLTPKEWQEMFPPSIYRRTVEDGETFYHRIGGRIEAEAYANIPEVKPCAA
jgi:hypothetical protein